MAWVGVVWCHIGSPWHRLAGLFEKIRRAPQLPHTCLAFWTSGPPLSATDSGESEHRDSCGVPARLPLKTRASELEELALIFDVFWSQNLSLPALKVFDRKCHQYYFKLFFNFWFLDISKIRSRGSRNRKSFCSVFHVALYGLICAI